MSRVRESSRRTNRPKIRSRSSASTGGPSLSTSSTASAPVVRQPHPHVPLAVPLGVLEQVAHHAPQPQARRRSPGRARRAPTTGIPRSRSTTTSASTTSSRSTSAARDGQGTLVGGREHEHVVDEHRRAGPPRPRPGRPPPAARPAGGPPRAGRAAPGSSRAGCAARARHPPRRPGGRRRRGAAARAPGSASRRAWPARRGRPGPPGPAPAGTRRCSRPGRASAPPGAAPARSRTSSTRRAARSRPTAPISANSVVRPQRRGVDPGRDRDEHGVPAAVAARGVGDGDDEAALLQARQRARR